MKALSHIVPFAGPDMPLRGDDWLGRSITYLYVGMASVWLLCRTFRSRSYPRVQSRMPIWLPI